MRCNRSSRGWGVGLLIFVGALASSLHAQIGPGKFYLSNRFVGAFESKSRERRLNDWLDIDYRYAGFTAGLRFELHDPANAALYNDKITQRYLYYQKDWLQIRAGNFYERLGRGLVFHAFEIQSETLDRTSQNIALDRNIDGANLKINLEKFEATAIYGAPLKMLSSERGAALGGEIRWRPSSTFMLGGAFLRSASEDFRGAGFHVDMRSAQAGWHGTDFELYAELAQKRSANTFSEPDGEALYASANYAAGAFGLSAEWKRYEKFRTVFNNPPALVKTHSFTLLNRHTHSLNADDETGYQLESYFSPSPGTTVTLHASGADNLAHSERRRFREYFIESRNEWSARLISRVLLDYSQDRPVGDVHRWTLAAEADYLSDEKNSVLLDWQFQKIENENSGRYWNYLGIAAFSRSPWLTLAAQYEHTSKRFAARRNWLAAIVNVKVGQAHDFYLTFGSRPAGLVCSGGICFQTPEFQGVELRWNLRY
ncbi:MAG: DUF6029 family protein [candidate division KSB1 bacterium]|nr:DUF6029 family protein [candidate division KSB1 bacterium]MDZ7369027.1 DUF6029 family protein [candidate division KSB1 bacterium]MDZ7407049.1 DUF6029 family protein [candidate division KSB1 bacterium]